jgi:hypothetical protein
MEPKCPTCGSTMSQSWMSGEDRFFSEMWECSCGFSASKRVLTDDALCQEAVDRFRGLGSKKLPSRNASPIAPRRGGADSIPTCRHCGRELKVYYKDPDDRFRDQIENCRCRQQSDGRKAAQPHSPYSADPDFGQIRRGSEDEDSSDPLGLSELMPKAETLDPSAGKSLLEPTDWPRTPPPLWASGGYLVEARIVTFEGRIGLPCRLEESEVRGGDGDFSRLQAALPKGFHLSLGPLVKPSRAVLELPEELLSLYQKLLEALPESIFEDTGPSGARDHWFALMAHFNQTVRDRENWTETPFEYVRRGKLPGGEYHFFAFLGELCRRPFLPSSVVPVSPWDVATAISQDTLDTLELEPGQTEILRQFIGV